MPGFSLFRRASSVVANPTTQGVSLRGIGSSGASRTLVLWDGIPVNDPFGGWVYWSRFAPEDLASVEISRGASTSVFGDRAMGGAIALFSREPEPYFLHGSYEGGNNDTHDLTAGFSNLFSRFGFSVDARAFTTDGYFIVPGPIRGAVDRRAGVDFVTGDVRLDYLGATHRLFFKADTLAEERRNGTVRQNNSTSLGTVSLHYQAERNRDLFSVLAFHTQEGFHSSFTSVPANRNSETLTYTQAVPSDATGGAGMWRHASKQWNLLAGADFFRVAGADTDSLYPTGKRIGGGDQFQHGLFAQSDYTWKALKLFAGLRHQFTGQGSTFLSPSAGLVAGKGRLRARGSVYRSFRAPTLNELFRDFRVGNTQTNANPDLKPETLFGSEAGLDWFGEMTHFSLTFYRNDIHNLITNRTLSVAPTLILRQRANAASALGRGAEFSATRRWRGWSGQLSYLYVDSKYGTGPLIPDVSRHQGSGQVSYQKGGTLATVGLRSFSYEFDDDQNHFLLPGYASVELMLRQRLSARLTALASLSNLLDHQYLTALTPTPTIGAPRQWRLGLRWEGRVH